MNVIFPSRGLTPERFKAGHRDMATKFLAAWTFTNKSFLKYSED